MRIEVGVVGFGNMVVRGGYDERSFNGILEVDVWLERVEKRMGSRKWRYYVRGVFRSLVSRGSREKG